MMPAPEALPGRETEGLLGARLWLPPAREDEVLLGDRSPRRLSDGLKLLRSIGEVSRERQNGDLSSSATGRKG